MKTKTVYVEFHDHNENCAIYPNSIDECDCERGQIRALQAKLKRVEDLAKQLQDEGVMRGVYNTIRSRVGDEIMIALRGGCL